MSAHLDGVLITDSKTSLGQLSKIPAKEFEIHFREWLERDDVARSLQAKLRADLILNFNKTALGKQLLSQSASSLGGSTHRLTLSPLILALNTLVAEFLYAVNCHFSLSVFSTEVPFRNTLPDFESSRCFRFTEREIVEIIEALCGNYGCEPSIKYKVAKSYANSGTTSLLLLIVKSLMQRVCLTPDVGQPVAAAASSSSSNSPRHRKTKTTATTMTPPHSPRRHATPTPPAAPPKEEHIARHELKTEIYNTNFRYLNKYLIVLSKKVKEMCEQFESLREMKYPSTGRAQTARLRVHKSANTRKFDNLNRSLELITKNLRQMNETKRRSKQVGAIVAAIDALSGQFQKCAVNFEKLSRGFVADIAVGTGSHRVQHGAEKQTGTETLPERSYTEWVREMRNSENGQKFLDRVESALSKALSKQRAHLEEDAAVKLKHQRQLLRVHYKQKLIEKLSQKNCSNVTMDSDKFTENIDKQLKQFEEKHLKLLHKISEAEREAIEIARKETNAGKVLDVIRENVLHPEYLRRPDEKVAAESSEPDLQAPLLAMGENTVPVFSLKPVTAKSYISQLTDTSSQTEKPSTAAAMCNKDMLVSTKHIQSIVKEIAVHDRNVEDIIAGAKQRIQELENVGNELDRNFRDYLQRQKLQKEATHEVAVRMCQSYASERENLRANIKKMKESTKLNVSPSQPMTPPLAEIEPVALRLDDDMKMSPDSGSPHAPNPIRNAKEKFFRDKPLFDLPELRGGAYLQSHYYTVEDCAALDAAMHSGVTPASVVNVQQQQQQQKQFKLKASRSTPFSIGVSSSGSSSLTKSTSSMSSHLGKSSSLTTTTSTTNSSDVPNNNNNNNNNNNTNNKYIVHSMERSKNPIARQRLLFDGIGGNARAQVPLANQNNSNGSTITLTRDHNKNTNTNGTTEMHIDLEHRTNANNTNNASDCNMRGGLTIYSVAQIPQSSSSEPQITENKRPNGNHDGNSNSNNNNTPPSTHALQQAMMKMKRLFSERQRPVELSDITDDSEEADGVNEVAAGVASGGRMVGAGGGAVGVASLSTTTLTAATVSTTQQRHAKQPVTDTGVGAVTQSKGVVDGGVGAVDAVNSNNNNVALRTNNAAQRQTMAAQTAEAQQRDTAKQEGMQSINDLVLDISDNDDERNKNAKFEGVVCEEVDDDDVDGVLEMAEDDSICEGIVSFEDVDEGSNDDDDDDDLSSGIKLKRTEAQMSFVRPAQSMRLTTGTEDDMERALQRLLAGTGNGEMEIGEVIIEEETVVGHVIGQNNADANTTSSTTGSSVEMKLSVAGRSGSGSGSDFWK